MILSDCFVVILTIVKGGGESDSSLFKSDTIGNTITGCDNIERFWTLVVAGF